jgi:membrane protein implicated in regulation of membrane protease activity
MGAMFVLLGGVLTVFGFASSSSIYDKSLGINVNLWWGLVIFLFGVSMLLLAWRAKVAGKSAPPVQSPGEREIGRMH